MNNLTVATNKSGVKKCHPLIFKIHSKGVITCGYDYTVLSPVEPYLGVKFSEPLTGKTFKIENIPPDFHLKNAITFLDWLFYNRSKLSWVTVTYQEASLDVLEAIAKNPNKLRLSYIDFLDNRVLYYVLAFGIQEITSFSKQLPCYDVNIILPTDIIDGLFLENLCYFTGKPLKVKTILNKIKWFYLSENDCLNLDMIGYVGNNSCNGKAYIETLSKDCKYEILKTRHHIPKFLKQITQPIVWETYRCNFEQFKRAIELLERETGLEFVCNKDDKQGLVYQCLDMTNLCYYDLSYMLLQAVLTIIRQDNSKP